MYGLDYDLETIGFFMYQCQLYKSTKVNLLCLCVFIKTKKTKVKYNRFTILIVLNVKETLFWVAG